MKNLTQMERKEVRPTMIQKINTWYSEDYLTVAFQDACTFTEGTPPASTFFWSDIWSPVKVPTFQGMPDEYRYINFGFTADEIADAYWAEYGANYFNEYYSSFLDFNNAAQEHKCKIIKQIRAVLIKNKYKYQKMIELAGFTYDPLSNVDAHELYSVLENHGGITRDSGSTSSSGMRTETKNKHNVAPYDGGDTATKTEYEDIMSGYGATYTPSTTVGSKTVSAGAITSPSSVSAGVAQTTDTETHNHAKNLDANGQEVDYTVDAKNNAFEADVKGGDYYKVEKHRRYGNIGVTKTTELLEAQRENLRFNLLQEFFDDINEVILVGIFDSKDYDCNSIYGGTTRHPHTSDQQSVINTNFDFIQSLILDEYGHVTGIMSNDGVTRMTTPITQEQYDAIEDKDLPLYNVYET